MQLMNLEHVKYRSPNEVTKRCNSPGIGIISA